MAEININGVAARLEEDAEVDVLAGYRRRRHLSEADELPYTAGLETARAWVAESASAAALRQAWQIAEGKAGSTAYFEASMLAFFGKEVEASRRESRWARFDPQIWSVECDYDAGRIVWNRRSPFILGFTDFAAASWLALREQDPQRAEQLANPGAPANRAALLDTLIESRDAGFARIADQVRAEMRARGEYDGSHEAVRRLVNEVHLRLDANHSHETKKPRTQLTLI